MMSVYRFILPAFATALLCGCDSAVKQFPPNRVHALVVATSRDVPTDVALSDVDQVLTAWFGTPDQPLWPSQWIDAEDGKRLVDRDNLNRASGRVYSDKQNQHFGLYAEHCVTCHGVAGGGDGPASLLQNPYPRDFRAGVFKWKSTKRAAKPTRDDIMNLLTRGVPGTGMPSFLRVEKTDREALVDYVIYLSVRGEFERRLLADAVDELGYEETAPDDDANLLELVSLTDKKLAERFAGQDVPVALEVARERLNEIVEAWTNADDEIVEVPPETSFDASSVERGRDLFHATGGGIVNCAGCHGPEGNGSVPTVDFDDWTKEYTTRLSISPEDRDAVKPFRSAGALRPRQIFPRKLDAGIYRGGGDSKTLYRRIAVGIAGTPMPSTPVSAQPTAKDLSHEQVWDLVHYVQSLGGVVAKPDSNSEPDVSPDGGKEQPDDADGGQR